jgi:hypothetical protein
MAVYSKFLAIFLPLLLSCLAEITVPAQPNQQGQESRTGKTKSVHEYSPEDILPDAQEDENPRPRRVQTGRPRQSNIKPVLSAVRENPVPSSTPLVKPATSKGTATTPTAVFPPATAQTNSPSLVQEGNRPHQKKLFISVSLFFVVLVILIFFISKFVQERRLNYETTFYSATRRERVSETQQPSESEPEMEIPVHSSNKVAREIKNKVRKVNHT